MTIDLTDFDPRGMKCVKSSIEVVPNYCSVNQTLPESFPPKKLLTILSFDMHLTLKFV